MKISARTLHLVVLAVFAIVTSSGCGPGTQAKVFQDHLPALAPTPVLMAISSPTAATAGGVGFSLVVTGTGFTSNSVVLWNGLPRKTQSVGVGALQADIPAADIAQAGIAKIAVSNPAAGNAPTRTSGTLDFPIFSLHLAALSPPSVLEGTAGASIEVLGTGFVQGSVVRWNGQTRPTTFTSDAKLIVTLAAADLAFADIAEVVVENPNAPLSNLQFFVVRSPGLSTERISLGDANEQLSVASYAPATDHTGNVVAYVQGDTASTNSVVARNTCLHAGAGCVVTNNVVSTNSSGDLIDFVETMDAPAVSDDGRWVAFAQFSSPPAEYINSELGLSDTCLGSVGSCTPSTSFPARNSTGQTIADVTTFPSLSADARYVAFTAGVSDGYSFDVAQPVVYDSCRGAAGSCTPSHFSQEALSETGQPVPFAFTSRQSLSADGRYLAFAGTIPANVYTGGLDGFGVWVRDSCRGADPSCVPASVRASIDPSGQQADGNSYVMFAMSASGRFVAFAPYSGGLFLRDTCIRASAACTPGTTVLVERSTSQVIAPLAFDLSISADGRRVAFALWNFDAFTQTATSSVFVRDSCIGATGCAPRTFLISAGSSGSLANGNSRAPMISGDGKFVVFQSGASDLIAGDTNGVTDIFRTVLP